MTNNKIRIFHHHQESLPLTPIQLLVTGFFGVIGPKAMIAPLDTFRVSKIIYGKKSNSVLWNEILLQGFPRLFHGYACDIMRIPNQSIFRYLLFDQLKRFMSISAADMLSSTAASIAAHPVDVIHTLMMTNPEKYPTIARTASIVWQRDGLKGFLCGMSPTIFGYIPYRSVQYGAQYLLRKFPIKKTPLSQFLVYGTVLTAAQFATYPFDVARKRMIADPSVRGKNFVTVISETFQQRGITGLYSGFGITMARNYAYTYLQTTCTRMFQNALMNFNYLLKKHKFD